MENLNVEQQQQYTNPLADLISNEIYEALMSRGLLMKPL